MSIALKWRFAPTANQRQPRIYESKTPPARPLYSTTSQSFSHTTIVPRTPNIIASITTATITLQTIYCISLQHITSHYKSKTNLTNLRSANKKAPMNIITITPLVKNHLRSNQNMWQLYKQKKLLISLYTILKI